jgi:CheY-like chemotaxis protein
LEAIQKTEEEKPDIILMDILLAGLLDGIEAAKIISYKHDVPIIYLSALNDEQTINRAKINPNCIFIRKPYSEFDLKNAIEMMLTRSVEVNRKMPPWNWG